MVLSDSRSSITSPLGCVARAMAARQIHHFLKDHGLDHEQVLQWVEDEEIEFIDDLAHAFKSSAHVMSEAPYIAEAWVAAAQRKTEAWQRTTDVKRFHEELLAAGKALVASVHAKSEGRGTKLIGRRSSGKPRPKPLAKAASVDKSARKKAAEAVVLMSLEWAPSAGVARGLTLADPLIPLVKEVHIERMALFEPKGLWASVKEWREWEEYIKRRATRGVAAEQEVLLTAYIMNKSAATGPLATWSRFDFLKRHLRADIPLEAVAKPPKKSGSDGVIRSQKQAVAMPPEYLMAYEDVLGQMIQNDDWRRVPVAASLQVAYSLVRVVHLGRSTFKHQSDEFYWLEAFRGKGKREGARTAFAWAMLRKGITGIDIGKVLYDCWQYWSQKEGGPLDYVAMDPDTGVKLESHHIQAVMRAVAAAWLPNANQVLMVQPYSNRRFGGTLASITKTPPTDIVAYGGWAGVPELAKVVTEASEVLMAWKRSMPHRYSDRRSEEEEVQKLLHMHMLRGLLRYITKYDGPKTPASWEAVENIALRSGDEGINIMRMVRTVAMNEVAEIKKDLLSSPVYGVTEQRRRQFTVRFVRSGQIPLPTAKSKKAKELEEASQDQEKSGTATPLAVQPPKKRKLDDTEATAEGQTEEQVPVKATREWVLTARSKYLHCVQQEGEDLFASCHRRKGPKARKPIVDERIYWRGGQAEAVSLRIQFCPAKACQP